MRMKVGRVVNVDAAVNLEDLSPLDRIIAAATNAYRNTTIYKRRYAETQEKIDEQRRRTREALSDSILQILQKQITENKLLSTKGDKCVGVLLEIPPKFVEYLDDILHSHEFDSYVLSVIKPSKTFEHFADPPYLLSVKMREGL